MNSFTMLLPCPLTNAERLRKAHELSECHMDLETIDGEKAEFLAEKRAQSKALRERMAVIAAEVYTGQEERQVECLWRLDYKAGTKVRVRLDTGEPVGEAQSLTDEDRQGLLFEQKDALTILEEAKTMGGAS